MFWLYIKGATNTTAGAAITAVGMGDMFTECAMYIHSGSAPLKASLAVIPSAG